MTKVIKYLLGIAIALLLLYPFTTALAVVVAVKLGIIA